MDNLERLKARTQEADEALLSDCLESAKAAIMARRYPFHDWPDELEARYIDLQYRIALALYEKDGAGSETSHTENGVSRTWGTDGIPDGLLAEVTPLVKVIG